MFCRINPCSSKVTRFLSVDGTSIEHPDAPGLSVNRDCKGGDLLVSFFFRPSLGDAVLVFHPSHSFRSWEFPIAQAFSRRRPSLGAGVWDAGEGAPVHPRAAELQRIVNTKPNFVGHMFSPPSNMNSKLFYCVFYDAGFWPKEEGTSFCRNIRWHFCSMSSGLDTCLGCRFGTESSWRRSTREATFSRPWLALMDATPELMVPLPLVMLSGPS